MTKIKNAPLLLNHAAELLTEWLLTLSAADRLKQFYFQKRTYLGSKDRTFIEFIFYDIIRNLRFYEWQIRENTRITNNIPASLLVVHVFKRHYPAVAAETVFRIDDEIARYFHDYEFRDPIPDSPAVRWSLPDIFWERIQSHYDNEELKNSLMDIHFQRGVHIRVNTLKTNINSLMYDLKDHDFRKSNISPDALRTDKYANLINHPLYRKGMFEFQDESSQLVAYACNPKKNDLVIDLCAGAGGKTLHLAALQQDRGTLVATDLYQDRLKNLKIRAARAGIKNLKLGTLSDVQHSFNEKADILLIDVPCSGSGVYGRHPDRKWKLDYNKLQYYLDTQRDILHKNAGLVKPGGILIYATCSLIPDENEKQIEQFLSMHPEFEAMPVHEELEKNKIIIPFNRNKVMLTILPYYFKSDGFFIARLKKNK